MKKLKVFLSLALMFTLLSNGYSKKPVKVRVFQDAFVQGGTSADEPMGVSKPGQLIVMKSFDNDKYSRLSYLQFNLKRIDDFESVDLYLCAKVYESKDDPSAEFALQVYSCDDYKWKETGITFNNKPEKGELLATQSIGVTEKNEWVKIQLPAAKIREMIKNNKKSRVSLVLYNEDFNRTSAIIISKERKWSNGAPAKREPYLEFK